MLLKEFITQVRGVSYKPSNILGKGMGIPILRANNIKDGKINLDDLIYIDKAVIKKEQILKSGDIVLCTSSGSKDLVGKAGTFNGNEQDISFGAFCKVVRVIDCDKINKDFIRLFFQSPTYKKQIADSSIGANINNIKTEHIDNLSIYIPSIKAQNIAVKEINVLIESIDGLEKKLSYFDELIKSRFNELFGDPLLNEKGFPVEKLSVSCPFNAYKGNVEITNGKVWLLNLDMIESNTGTVLSKQYVCLSEVGNSVIKFDKDCVLYSKLRPYLNKVVISDGSGYASSELVYMKTGKRIRKEFLANLLRSKSFVDYIDSKSGGAKMPRASMDFLRSFPLIVPPERLQEQFATFVNQIDKSKFVVQQQIMALEELLNKKMDEYFGGE